MHTLESSVRSNDVDAVRRALAGLPASEIGAALVRLDPADQAALLRMLSASTAAEVFERLHAPHQRTLLAVLAPDDAATALEHLAPDDRARLLEQIPTDVRDRLLDDLTVDAQAQTRLLLGHPAESAGRIMTPAYVALLAGSTAGEALDHVRQVGADAETILVLYVIDDRDRLLGVVSLKDLVLADPNVTVRSLMTTAPVRARTDDDREVVARRLFADHLLAVPVTDEDDRLVGIVTVDDAMAVLDDEGTEDVARLGGSSPLDVPYLTAGVLRLFRARIGWLLVLFVAEALTGTIMRLFEDTLQSVVALAFFVPLMIGTGGNAGSQTTTTIVRAMATDDVRFGDVTRVMWKEVRVGVLLGISMAGVGLLRAATWGTGGELAIVVGLGLMSVVVLASLVGSFLPLALARMRLDPAVVSAPFITTFVDATGLLIYFGLARAILS